MKVLFAGLGAIGQRHLRNLHALLGDALEVAAYRVRRQTAVVTERLELDAGASVEEKYGVRVFDALEEGLERFRPEAVFVCNPTNLHVPVALAAARAGAHLFIEKPLGADLEGADELARLVEERGLVALVGFQMRFHPAFRRLRELVEDEALGPLLAVRARYGEYLPDFHPYEDYRQSYAAREALGGGVIRTQIHDLDYLLALFGMPARVFALGGHLSALEIDVEDVASIALDCRRYGRQLPVHLHQDFVTRPPERRCTVIGEEGIVEVDFRAPELVRRGPHGEIAERFEPAGFERNAMFLDLLRHFLASIEGRERPVVGIADAILRQRVALAARASISHGRAVDPMDLESSGGAR